MVGRRYRNALAWAGLSVVLVGFLTFVASYFLLPVYVTTLNCFDYCSPAKHATMWQFSLNLFSHVPVTPITNSILLLLCYLSVFGALTILGCSLSFLVSLRRVFMVWSRRGLLAGGVALVIVLAFLLLFVGPQLGYLGMLLGYGLFWAGDGLFLCARRHV
jgi:hypothetical protein